MTKIICDEIVTSKVSSTSSLKIGLFTWPSVTPTAGSVLKTDGEGNLQFQETNTRTVVDQLSTSHTIDIDSDIIAITGTLDTTLTLPDPSTKTIGDMIYIVKEVDGTSVITILPFASELISGATSAILSDAYGTVKIYTNGTAWFALF